MNILFELLVLFSFLNNSIHNRIIKKEDYDLSNIFPKFMKAETMPSSNESFLKFQILQNYTFEYNYRLFISQLDKNAYQLKMDFYKNWLYEDEDYDSFLENNNNLWKNWYVYRETNERIIKLSNLLPSKYQMKN